MYIILYIAKCVTLSYYMHIALRNVPALYYITPYFAYVILHNILNANYIL